MKIQLFIMTFLLLLSPSFSQTYSVVKGSVYGVSTKYDVIERANSKMNAGGFEKGTQLHLTEDWGICTIREKGRAHMFFSNRMSVWIGGKTTLWIDNFEQFADKDEQGKPIIDDGSFVGNFRVNGDVDFKLEKISDSGYFNVSTNGASLDVKSKRFYVSTFNNLTTVECYDGEITMTDSETLKDTVLKAGEVASVYGRDGRMNSSISITKLTDTAKENAKGRITVEEVPDWNLLKPSPKIP